MMGHFVVICWAAFEGLMNRRMICLSAMLMFTQGEAVEILSVESREAGRWMIRFTAEGYGSNDLSIEVADDLSTDTSFTRVPTAVVNQGDVWVAEIDRGSVAAGFFRIMAVGQSNGVTTSQVVISEVVAQNESGLTDEDGEFSDWIELANLTDEAVSLEGWALDDDSDRNGAWVLPDVSLGSGEYLVIYCSGKDRVSSQGEIHTDFRLSAAGETVSLWSPDGRQMDSIRFPALEEGQSLTRRGETGGLWGIQWDGALTPGRANPADTSNVYVEPVLFSRPAGFYDQAIEVKLDHGSTGATIVYTLDGSSPTEESTVLEGPIAIEGTTTIRALVLGREGHPSQILTSTYFVGDEHELPVMTLSGDPAFFDIRNGYLYGFGEHLFTRLGVTANFPYSASNAWKDREIEVACEFFENAPGKPRVIDQNLGVKIFGGWGSRGYPQKSLALFARGRYGQGSLRHQMFPGVDIDRFESLVLRNSGNDNQSSHHIPPRPPITAFSSPRSNGSYFVNGTYTLIRDAVMTRLAGGLGLDVQAYRPVVLYLNGEYWGIYNLREKLNEHYVASHHGLAPEDIDLIEGYGTANAGTGDAYRNMTTFLSRTSLTRGDGLQRVEDRFLDVDNFIDYHLSVIYAQNFDIGNIKSWRSREGGDGKFRWMLYDQDYGFNLWPEEVYVPAMARDYSDYENMFDFYTNERGSGTGWPNASGRTLLLRKLLVNPEFKQRFINRCADLLNTSFTAERVIAVINELSDQIRGEMPAHLERWSWEALASRGYASPFKPEDDAFSLDQWHGHLNIMRQFAQSRPEELRRHLMEHFGFEGGLGEVEVDIDAGFGGEVTLNSLTLEDDSWLGQYFVDVPITIQAEPFFGFEAVLSYNGEAIHSGEQLTIQRGAQNRIRIEFKSL